MNDSIDVIRYHKGEPVTLGDYIEARVSTAPRELATDAIFRNMLLAISDAFNGNATEAIKTLKSYAPEALKAIVGEWITDIDKDEILPHDIIALSFNIYEPYGLELVGSKRYDANNEDWACEEDFVPKVRRCPDFQLSGGFERQEVLDIVVNILKALCNELSDSRIFNVQHIAAGFVDGKLTVIK